MTAAGSWLLCQWRNWISDDLPEHCSIADLHTLFAGLLARSKYPDGPETGHLGTGFSSFSFVYKQMLRWFPRLQVATTCFSCSPPNLKLLDPYSIFTYMHNNHCHRATAHLKLNILLLLLLLKTLIFLGLKNLLLKYLHIREHKHTHTTYIYLYIQWQLTA